MQGTVLIVYGFPGSGKSTLSNMLCPLIPRSKVLSNDIIRRKLSLPLNDSSFTPIVYDHLADRARAIIENECTAILDATFYLKKYRKIVEDKLWPLNPRVILIKISTPIEICRKRIVLREKNKENDSLSYIPAFERVLETFEPWDSNELIPDSAEVCFDCSDYPKPIERTSNIPKQLLPVFLRSFKGVFYDLHK